MKYEYGVEYPTNGKKPDLPDDVKVVVRYTCGELSSAFAVKYWRWDNNSVAGGTFRIVDERYKPKAEQIDNSWHERGELPPVGTVCEMLDADLAWRKVEILAHTRKGMVVEWYGKEFLQNKDRKFRPIKTERESLIDSLKHEVYLNCINNLDCISMKQSTGEAVAAAVIGYMLDAGFRSPEDK